MDELEIAFGDAIKMDSNGAVTGYLVRFGDENATDLAGDFFTPQTDFGRPFVKNVPQPLNLYYAHGFDKKIGRKAVGTGTIKMDEVGLWFEAQIQQSDAYRKKLAELASMKRLGYSSGAAAHMVDREPIKDATGAIKAQKITVWPLGEGSLTPQPCEPQNQVAGKSLFTTGKTLFMTGKSLKEALTAKGWLYEDDDQAATRLTMAVLRTAHDRLYSVFYDVLCYQTAPREARLASLTEALDEFEDICLRYATAVMLGTAAEGSTEASEAIKSLRALVKTTLSGPKEPADGLDPDFKHLIAVEQAKASSLLIDVAGLTLGHDLALVLGASEEAG